MKRCSRRFTRSNPRLGIFRGKGGIRCRAETRRGMTILDGSSGVAVFGPLQCGERLNRFTGFLLGEAKLVEAL